MTAVYLIFILLACYYSWKYDGIEGVDQHKSHRYWLLCIMLICISGFSYGLGSDKFVYMEAFEDLPNNIDSLPEYIYLRLLLLGHMPLWTLLNVFVKKYFDSFYVLQFIQSGIINPLYCYIAYKYTHRQFLFLIVYFLSGTFFYFNMDVMREGFAIACCLIAIERYMNGNKSHFYLLTVLGILFHISAAIVLIFPICRFRIKRRVLFFSFGTSLAIWILSDLLLSHATTIAIGGIGALVKKILLYSSQATTLFGFLRSAITFIIFPFFVMYYNIKWETNIKQQERKEKFTAFYLVLSVCACSFAGFTRLRNYAEIYILIFFTDFVYLWLKTKERFFVRTVCLIGLLFLTSLKFLVYYPITKAHFYDFFIPYTCILNEDKNVFIRKAIHDEQLSPTATDENVRDLE